MCILKRVEKCKVVESKNLSESNEDVGGFNEEKDGDVEHADEKEQDKNNFGVPMMAKASKGKNWQMSMKMMVVLLERWMEM